MQSNRLAEVRVDGKDLVDSLEECRYQPRVKVLSTSFADDLEAAIEAHGFFVTTFASKSIEDICDGNDTAFNGISSPLSP